MNLQSHIKPELWDAISSTYGAENYSPAILDAIHYLSDILREKSGAEGDGASLVGQALGGDSPKLRLNKLQTETERNEQKGFLHILMGVYEAIRNPRSHEQIKDNQSDADAIIYFINYLLSILDESRERFTTQEFLERVFDPDFVANDHYADLLASEIPNKKLGDTLIEIYRKKLRGNGRNLCFIVKAILAKLSEQQLSDFLAVVSDEFKVTTDELEIRYTLQILPPSFWPMINELARIRIENKLLQSIKIGESYVDGSCNAGGAFGTWAITFLKYFSNKDEICSVLIGKMVNQDADVRRYAAKYFLTYLPDIVTYDWMRESCLHVISNAIINDDEVVKGAFKNSSFRFPDDWRKDFEDLIKDVKNPDGSSFFVYYDSSDDIPF